MAKQTASDLLLGIDAGTTLLKASVYSPGGVCLGSSEAPQGTISPQPSWVEQDPVVWWDGLRQGVCQAMVAAGVSGDQIAAIGLSTQAATIGLFEQDGSPRGPALVWSDSRQRASEADPQSSKNISDSQVSLR